MSSKSIEKSLPKLIEKIYAYVLTIGSMIGLIAMTWQSIERIHMLKNPGLELNCTLNPVVDCGSVLGNHLSAILGFPNAFLGMIFFTILLSSGLLLVTGGKFTQQFRHFIMAVSVALILFSIWFFGVSIYILGKICIFCVFGWVVSVPLFWYGLIYYLQNTSNKLTSKRSNFLKFAYKHHVDVIIFVYAVMVLLFLYRFREYYFS